MDPNKRSEQLTRYMDSIQWGPAAGRPGMDVSFDEGRILEAWREMALNAGVNLDDLFISERAAAAPIIWPRPGNPEILDLLIFNKYSDGVFTALRVQDFFDVDLQAAFQGIYAPKMVEYFVDKIKPTVSLFYEPWQWQIMRKANGAVAFSKTYSN